MEAVWYSQLALLGSCILYQEAVYSYVSDHSKMMESKNVCLHNTLHFMKCFQMYRLFYLNYSVG